MNCCNCKKELICCGSHDDETYGIIQVNYTCENENCFIDEIIIIQYE
jgi:hypothetical protein